MADSLLTALAAGITVFDLGRPLFTGMPQSRLHPEFRMVLQRRHGDLVRPDGTSGANELIITGGHVGTHIDALSHIASRGVLFGGVDAHAAQTGQAGFCEHGVETLPPIVTRGVLLNVAEHLGIEACPPAYEVTVDDLQVAADVAGVSLLPGDTVLIRTGWGRYFDDRIRFEGAEHGTPGIGESAARWLADHRVVAVGGDTIAFEHKPPSTGLPGTPAHRVLLVESGIPIIEVLDLESLAAAGVHEFVFVLSPLKIVGATGSPARPLAVVSSTA